MALPMSYSVVSLVNKRTRKQMELTKPCMEYRTQLDTPTSYPRLMASDGKIRQITWIVYAQHYKVSFADIEQAGCIMHLCDNRKCIEPTHLRMGSYSENTQDMHDKGRGSGVGAHKGSEHHFAKLTEETVKEIKRLRYQYLGKQLARKFNVSRATVSMILNGKIWQHVT